MSQSRRRYSFLMLNANSWQSMLLLARKRSLTLNSRRSTDGNRKVNHENRSHRRQRTDWAKLVNILRERGHEVVAASPSSGVNTITGEGLSEALTGAQVVVDVANSPSFEDKAVLEFFETSGRNLLAAEAAAGVRHHVALSVVGTDRLLASGYFRAKMAQEKLIKASNIPYTIVRATQFFEFVGAIAQSATDGQTVRLPSALMQPIVSDDVAAALADVALAKPLNGTVELAGPDPIPHGRSRAAILRRSARHTPRDHRSPGRLLWHAGERSKPHAWRKPAPRPNAFRGLA